MTSTPQRLWRLGAVYALVFAVVAVHLAGVMLVDHEDWLVRSYRNRWAFRDVPSVRGALRDRFDRLLVHDEPTFELECVYERFRLLHPVGAAVHGATLAARLLGNEVRYAYEGTALGPEAAARDLLALPVGTLLRGDLPKEDKKSLLHAATTVLAAVGDRSRGRVVAALRVAADRDPARPLAAVLDDLDEAQVLAQFAGVLSRLRALDTELRRLESERAGADAGPRDGARADDDEDGDDPDGGTGADDGAGELGRVAAAAGAAGAGVPVDAAAPRARLGLLQRLDRFRIDSLEGRRTRHRGPDGTLREGDLVERLARPVARTLPFAVAAALRVAADDQPGLRLEPALRRVRAPDLPPTLRQVLGRVRAIDQTADVQAYVDSRVEQALGGELEELVPDDLTPSPEYRRELMAAAQRNYERVLRTRERRGTGGIESMLDDALAGAPGMRLVERDARAKEQLLWSSLRVEPGTDVSLSVDLDLQRVLEREVGATAARWRAEAQQGDRIDAAMAIVDARSGDVLALAGAPLDLDGRPRLPAVLAWRGTGALGSVVKPFALLEQLRAERLGLPHADLAHLEPCPRVWKGPDRRTYRCDAAHWAEGTDPVTALAKSCNVFFFQVACGLGEDGLRRALWRFGLVAAEDGGDDGRYLERPRELPAGLAAAPRWIGRQALPMRGIGYGIEANPLTVAAAYAGLATGSLPTLGLRRGEARPQHELDFTPAELALVAEGMRACVERGTAKAIDGLRELGVLGKTGTAEIVHEVANNAWFAGYVPVVAQGGVQLAFAAVVYGVPQGVHGAEAAGTLVADVLRAVRADTALATRYLEAEHGR